MSRKIVFPDIDDLCQRYISGESLISLSKEKQVALHVLKRSMCENGVTLRTHTREAIMIPDEAIVAMYFTGMNLCAIADVLHKKPSTISNILVRNGVELHNRKNIIPKASYQTIVDRYTSGESEKAIADSLIVSRQVIRRILQNTGTKIRGIHEANTLMMSQRTPEEHRRNTARANTSVRGIPQTYELSCKLAKSRQRNMTAHICKSEQIVIDALRNCGIDVTPQKAVGRYNIDIAIEKFSIAVEIFGGNWHAYGRHAARFRKRFDFLLDCGWLPIIIWDCATYPLTSGAVEYIISVYERLSRGEPIRRQEHVIRGDGNPTGIGQSQLDYRAAIGGNKCGKLVRCEDGRFTNEASRV